MKNCAALYVVSIESLKNLKFNLICDKTLFLCSICNKYGSEDQKIFKDEEE